MISMITDEKIYFEKGYYHGVYVLIKFIKDDSANMKEDQECMYEYMDEEDME